jgi:diacylglycerol kinase family enzyme
VKRILILHNPTSGRRRAGLLRATVACLLRRGVAVELFETRRAGEAEERTAELGDRYDVVVAAGGDGTVREVANGLVGKGQPLGVIPIGTTNVLAGELCLPRSPEALAAVLAEGRSTRVHPGLLNGRRFLEVAGVGLDAWVVAAIDLERKRRGAGRGAARVLPGAPARLPAPASLRSSPPTCRGCRPARSSATRFAPPTGPAATAPSERRARQAQTPAVKRILILYNPTSARRRGRLLRSTIAYLLRRGRDSDQPRFVKLSLRQERNPTGSN